VRYDEDHRLRDEQRIIPGRGDSWRPPPYQRQSLTRRDDGYDASREDPRFWGSSEASWRSVDETSATAVRPVEQTAWASQPNLDPSAATFQPSNNRSARPAKAAAAAPLRSVLNYARYPTYRVDKYYRSPKSADLSSNWSGRSNNRNNFESTRAPHRYPLRSRHPAPSVPAASDASHVSPDWAGRSGQRHRFGIAAMLSTLQPQPERKETPRRPVSPPPAPTATDLYLAQARLPVVRSAIAKKLLVVLDLNGTLLVRPNRMQPRVFNVRPGVPPLLDYLFDNHVVMVYSSARPANVEAMVDTLVAKKRAKKLAAIWGRDRLELTTAQYNEKIQVYKKLEKLWADDQIQATCPDGRWSQANTVLVDDSHLKALSQPHNLLQVPEFTKKQKLTKEERRRELEVVATLRARLEELRWTHDVSRLILRWQTGEVESTRATKLSQLPKAAGKGNAGPISGAASGGGVNLLSDEESDDAGVSLEEGMERLTTDPVAEPHENQMSKPAVSADEWREFLK
jgi:NLI interacting factor-like phosphatase